MTRNPLRSLASLVLLCLPLPADFNSRDWQYRKKIIIEADAKVAELLLDREVFLGSQSSLADLRIVRAGSEKPYVVETLASLPAIQSWIAVEVTDKAFRPGLGVEVVVRKGGARGHNRVQIQTRRKNFRANVRIEASGTGAEWVLLRESAPIFDFTDGERSYSSLLLSYPQSTRRYMRFTVKGWTDPEDVSGAKLAYSFKRPAERVLAIETAAAGVRNTRLRATEYLVDLGGSGIPQDRAQFTIDGGPFHRAVEVEASSDSVRWWRLGGGAIFRVEGEDSLEIGFPETRGRYLRFRIFEGDDPPLSVRRILVSGLARRVRFQGEGLAETWLYYGNPDARQPEYDFGKVLVTERTVQTVLATLGKQERSPAYVPPPPKKRPWTEEHPALLWTVLITAVLGLGGISVRILMRAGSSPNSP